MKVNITQAAKMVGITRPTLYKHIESKGISVEEDEDGRGIDVSELVRVYGDKVRQLEIFSPSHDIDDGPNVNSRKQATPNNTAVDSVEVEVLRERVKYLEADKIAAADERSRERDMLLERLEKSEEQQKRLTLLLTDQTQKGEDQDNQDKKRLDMMQQQMAKLQRQNAVIARALKEEREKSFFKKLFS